MKLLIFACLIAYVSAHACLVFPQQRGGFPNNALHTEGADACGLTTSPCGGKAADTSYNTIFKGGEKYNITFQKNLDHYYKDAPGSWDLVLWQGTSKIGTPESVDDPPPSKVGTGDFVTVPFQMPSKGRDNDYIMQLSYVTNNPEIKKVIFYQCADITIM